jgi:hypothetical protein
VTKPTAILSLLLIAFFIRDDAELSACPLCRLGAACVVGTYDQPVVANANTQANSPTTRPVAASQDHTLTPSSTALSAPKGVGRLPFGLSLSGGDDVTTAYYHRGYLMGNQGVITQPYLIISRPLVEARGLSITPYVGAWTDFQKGGTHNSGQNNGTASNGSETATMFCCPGPSSASSNGSSIWITPPDVPVAPGATSGPALPGLQSPAATTTTAAAGPSRDFGYGIYEADVTAGVAINAGPLFLDLKYTDYTYPDGALSGYQEIGARCSVDLIPLCLPSDRPRSILFRPFLEVDRETNGLNQGEFTYAEAGVEPSGALRFGRTVVGVSLPVTVGLSASGFYKAPSGSNEIFGYISAGCKGTIPILVSRRYGNWYLSATATYLYLGADSLRILNSDHRNEVLGSLGLGFQF